MDWMMFALGVGPFITIGVSYVIVEYLLHLFKK